MLSKKVITRLREAIDTSRKDLRPFREQRNALISEYVGAHYGHELGKSRLRTPLNVLERAVNIYTMLLAGEVPQVLVTAQDPQKAYFAEDIESVINREVRKINLGVVIQEAVIDAYFSMGIVKVGLDYAGDRIGSGHSEMEPFAEIVHLDDWVQDMSAQKYEYCEFAGNRYSVPLDFFKQAVKTGYFSRAAADKVNTSVAEDLRIDEDGETRTQSLSVAYQRADQVFRKQVKLWDIWVPSERLLITIPGHRDDGDVVLRQVEWDGVAEGPFKLLGFNDVPGNPLPNPPANQLLDLHLAINDITRKLVNQSLKQRTIWAYQGGQEDQARRGRDAADGDLVKMDDPNGTVPIRIGGLDQQVQAFSMYLENRFDVQAGNISALGGLRSGADTLGQEQQMLGQATRQVARMREKTQRFTEQIIRDLAWRWWTDPERTYRSDREIKGTKLRLPINIDPAQRAAEDIRGYDLLVEPFSMEYKSPTERAQSLMEVVNQAVTMLPLMEAQGMTLDMEVVFSQLARYLNMPEIKRVVRMEQTQGSGDSVRQAAKTERTYTRKSEGGGGNGQSPNVPIPKPGGGNAMAQGASVAQG